MPAPIYVSIDTTDITKAKNLIAACAPYVAGIKLGLEFFMAHGPTGIAALKQPGLGLFIDVKLHDIPNTVAAAVRALLPLQPDFITLHASGGAGMLKAASDAALESENPPALLAVTALTSLDATDISALGVQDAVPNWVQRLGTLATQNGISGLVCSPQEVALLRQSLGPKITLMVPGIRPAGSAVGDQKRVMIPVEAIAAGATYLVIGRPITGAENPSAAAKAIADTLL